MNNQSELVREFDTKEFYDLMQWYRHSPITDQDATYKSYEEVKKYIENFIIRRDKKNASELIEYTKKHPDCDYPTFKVIQNTLKNLGAE